ncbi:MAG: hypothetical protein CVV42_05665 [Candidatus Riflebacteria bacterium HGW-Riflebacteria-2]|jgi:uncharacterized protein (DUF2225 family)|nr:MAG: hypothetical protein CVV42_05665 [Candidatus Riflebacteria bacterium HGW-Riflebacteria-2]
MSLRKCLFVFLLTAILLCPGIAHATRSKSIQLECPVCGNSLTGSELMSTNNFGGVDSDFMQRPMGASPILIRPTTCIKCGFSGYVDDFSSEAKKNMPATFTAAIKLEKALKPAVYLASYTEQSDIPAWVKYDLIAQVRKLENAPAGDIAHQYLSASWALRMEAFTPLPEENLKEMEKLLDAKFSDRLKKRDRNGSSILVEIGLESLKLGESASQQDKPAALTGAIFLLRRYGENPGALKAMQLLSPLLASDTAQNVEKALKESIDHEQHFQKLAVENFKTAIKTETDAEMKARFCYLTGELYRRLGDHKEARAWFEQVRAIKERPSFLDEMMTEVEQRMSATE